MKRRLFLAAGVGSAAILTGTTRTAQAAGADAEVRLQVWKCEKCGTIVEVLVAGESVTLTHCRAPMKLLEEQTAPAAENKHVPVITPVAGGFKVAVGSTPHPMAADHYIEWIDLIADNKVYREYLKPGDKPEAVFLVKAKKVSAREHCNKHGLWKNA